MIAVHLWKVYSKLPAQIYQKLAIAFRTLVRQKSYVATYTRGGHSIRIIPKDSPHADVCLQILEESEMNILRLTATASIESHTVAQEEFEVFMYIVQKCIDDYSGLILSRFALCPPYVLTADLIPYEKILNSIAKAEKDVMNDDGSKKYSISDLHSPGRALDKRQILPGSNIVVYLVHTRSDTDFQSFFHEYLYRELKYPKQWVFFDKEHLQENPRLLVS
jgi:hypothetical protein